MGSRRWQIPAAVAAVAASSHSEDPVMADRLGALAAKQPVASQTLEALIASADTSPVIRSWASAVHGQALAAVEAQATDVLVAAGFDPTGCTPDAYGILDPDFEDGERILAVVRASVGGYERYGTDGWEPCQSPAGMPYAELRGDVLADAIGAAASGLSLICRATQPVAFIAAKAPGALVAAVDLTKDDTEAPEAPADGDQGTSGVYAVTDQFDTSAVITLFRASPGPTIEVRRGGQWIPDDGTLLGQLKSVDPPPVVAVPPDQVDSVSRQVDDFESTHPQSADHPTGGGAQSAEVPAQPGAVAAAATVEPRVAGLCVRAGDTGRVFMIQRALDPGDRPDVRGTWEFPGGHIEGGDADPASAAQREWEEETGHPLPGGKLNVSGAWDSPDGLYRGHVHDIPSESDIDITDRDSFTNPDDPDGDRIEAVAWWDPALIAGNPAIRPELRHTAHLVHTALDPASVSASEAVAASAHSERVAAAHDADAKFDADRAEADLTEQQRRRAFEETVAGRHPAMVNEGIDPDEAASAVAREIAAEDARREMWEKDRFEALEAERVRRLRVQPELRKSAAEERQVTLDSGPAEPIAADAAPHTSMPPQLVRYWTTGVGGAKIRWGTPGDFNRCRRQLAKYLHPNQIAGACNELHKIATGIWPATHAKIDRELVKA